MKVKKKKEQRFAVKWDGGHSGIPLELIDVFGDMVEVQDWGDYSLDISTYSSEKGWKTTNVSKGMWVVFSDRKKIKKVMDDYDFKERYEGDS